ncbi:unnamed protein product [Ostreobium quekettii]|uniref:Uncharacterized protein n=1 Tax=Ostreobium quekettii TaxID=121088 RepID=A0A8S1IXU3_9CHLO|nr:unnamed protein product [Ostreobium quekettii]
MGTARMGEAVFGAPGGNWPFAQGRSAPRRFCSLRNVQVNVRMTFGSCRDDGWTLVGVPAADSDWGMHHLTFPHLLKPPWEVGNAKSLQGTGGPKSLQGMDLSHSSRPL